MKMLTMTLLGASLSAVVLSGCAVRVPGASVEVDPWGRLERHSDGRYYDRDGRDYYYRDGRYYNREGRGFCPPGQAKKGRC